MKYIQKPKEQDAIQFTGSNYDVVIKFTGGKGYVEGNPISGKDVFRIPLPEGIMSANENDYIIKGDNGSFYSCLPDIFEQSYEPACEKTCFDFGQAIEMLRQEKCVRRRCWIPGLCVIKQIRAHIGKEIIPNMQSLPQSAKDIILNGIGFIDYTSQCLLYSQDSGFAESWVPSISDIFAEDWMVEKPMIKSDEVAE